MKEDILNTKNEALGGIMDAQDANDLERIRIEYLGRNGRLSSYFQQVKNLSDKEKKEIGQMVNETKRTLESSLEDKKNDLTNTKVTHSNLDLTIPGMRPEVGNLHGLTTTLTKITEIFNYLGYQVADGPEIETDYYNFEALNIPKDHPARDTQQTLYVDTKGSKYNFGEIILRTQTSAMQGRVMEKTKPPFKIIVPGMNYRYEQVDASHGFEFGQVEGFVVGEHITLTDLFGTIEYVLNELFDGRAKLRFATTNFPFVEPGVDTYMECTICEGHGCSFCKNTGWSEIMPAGMIHPNVLEMAGIDSKKWGGFAFAIGSSRITNLKYHIQDLRTQTLPDLRILKQF